MSERQCRYPCDCGQFDDEHCSCMEGHAAPEPADQTLADVVLTEGDQLDGIDPQGSDLPSAKAAAKRVGAFLQEFGDGIVLGGGEGDLPQLPALYARDLEVLRRAALDGER